MAGAPVTGETPAVGVDTLSPVPPYEQVRAQLAELVAGGVLGPGDRLPPIRQLAADLGIAPGTVARAYRLLESAGLVRTGRGGGTRVVADPPMRRPGRRSPHPPTRTSGPGGPPAPRTGSCSPRSLRPPPGRGRHGCAR